LSELSLFQDAAFGQEIIGLMEDGFERACRSLQDTGQKNLMKEVIAYRIIDGARCGIRDPHELCVDAIKSLGLSGDCE
jgi:hypothetical protein